MRPHRPLRSTQLEIRVLPSVPAHGGVASRALLCHRREVARLRGAHRGWLLRNRPGARSRARGVCAVSYAPIHAKLDAGALVVLDGAIGTEILRRQVTWADHQLQSRPELVRSIHSSYLAA